MVYIKLGDVIETNRAHLHIIIISANLSGFTITTESGSVFLSVGGEHTQTKNR